MAGPPFPSSIAVVVCYCCRCLFDVVNAFFFATAIAASSSSLMIHKYLYMSLMIWFCKWV